MRPLLAVASLLGVALLAVAAVAPAPAGAVDAPFRLNVGGGATDGFSADNDGDYVVGESFALTEATVEVKGTDRDDLYLSYRYYWGRLNYAIPVSPGDYEVRLHFAELWPGAFFRGARVFNVYIGGVEADARLDIFGLVGSRTALVRAYNTTVGADGTLAIDLWGVEQNPALAAIEVLVPGAEPPLPTLPPAASTDPTDPEDGATLPLRVNVGGGEAADAGFSADAPAAFQGFTEVGSGTGAVAGTSADALYRAYRFAPGWGTFSVRVPLAAGAYTVRLHWAEMWDGAWTEGARVFDVALGDGAGVETVEDKLDVYATAGPATALVRQYTVSVETSPLVIRLVSRQQNAMLSAYEVLEGTGFRVPTKAPPFVPPTPTPSNSPGASATPEPSATPSPPPPTSSTDHFAHAVIGKVEDMYVDNDGNGEEAVTITGFGSHTHYFFNNGTSGSLVRTEWYNNDTEALLGSSLSLTYTFGLGTTNVRLDVEDTTGDTSSDFATVSVVGSLRPGAYCYYYGAGTDFPLPLDVKEGPKAVFAATAGTLRFPNAGNFPEGAHGTGEWVQRCVFFYNAPSQANYTFAADYTGRVEMHMDAEKVFGDDGTGRVELSEGLHEGQVFFAKTSDAAKLLISVNGTALPAASIQHDQNTVVPVITGMFPDTGGRGGGTSVTINGVGFFTSAFQVFFGDTPAASVQRRSATQLIAISPPGSAGAVDVTVVTGGDIEAEGGTSNGFTFTYEGDAAPIQFKSFLLKDAGGNDSFSLWSGIAITFGPDGRYYVSVYDSQVWVLSISADHRVTDVCRSESLGENTVVTSVAFNPADGDQIKLYVTAAVLYYHDRFGMPLSAWDNGRVLMMEPNVNGQCLGISKEVITGLPVSNHDHSASGLGFDQDGLLRILSPGLTNMGTSDGGERLGGLDETSLSAAMLIADVNKPDFDGAITYDTKDELTSTQTGGFDVKIYAVGLRSAFGSAIHTNGEWYATDNGPNETFGNLALGCNNSRFSSGHGDKVLRMARGAYYGHPNRNRAREDPRQCTYYWPLQPGTAEYKPPLTSFSEGSYNGIIEVMSNVFPDLKHDLLISRFSTGNRGNNGLIKRVQLVGGRDGPVVVSDLLGASGLDIESTPSGAYYLPYVCAVCRLLLSPRPPCAVFSNPRASLTFEGGVSPACVLECCWEHWSDSRGRNLFLLVTLALAMVCRPPAFPLFSCAFPSYLYSRTQKGEMLVVEPVYPTPPANGRPVPIAVKPHRGPKGGGHTITVGGHNFGTAPTATLGDRPCRNVRDVAADGTSFRCTVPAAAEPGSLVRIAVTNTETGKKSARTPGNGDYLYMNI